MTKISRDIAHTVRGRIGRATLLLTASASAMLTAAAPAYAEDAETGTGDIVVTAQRREESILRVPISITGFSTEQLDQQGIKDIRDLSRLAPSLQFTRTAGVSGNNGTNIAIRGISSDVGSATTAIYIDDTPIQIRSVGYFSGNPYPRVFDLQRIEVLRGPQGTLFGASAEGGAVRFITPQPDFERSSVYAKGEISGTDNGGISYEGGIAAGVPLSDTLAVRISGWYRRDAGYIDRVNPQTGVLLASDINSQKTYATKIALSWKPIDDLTITPGFYLQRNTTRGRDQYWEGYGDASSAHYVTGIFNLEPGRDRFYMPSLKVEVGAGNIDIISNTSYFVRDEKHVLDYSTFLATLRTGNPFGSYGNKDVTNAVATQTMGQRVLTQELRVQSFSPTSLIDWVGGVYYTRAIQKFQNLSGSGRIPGVISSGFPQYLGRYNLFDNIRAKDEQIAGFANVDVKPMDGLKITLGARVTNTKFSFDQVRDGPTNSGVRSFFSAGQEQTSFTPKLGVSYQIDPSNMIYASASKGFRAGGAQSPVDPTFCGADLATLGLTSSPREFSSDSLWSYEAGTKNKLFGGAVVLDANVYMTKWKNIQQSVRLPRCSFSFIANLGNATSKGTDISLSLNPVKGLTIGGSVGYNDTTYDSDVVGGNGLILRSEGARIGGPKWTGTAFGQVEAPLGDTVDGYFRGDFSFASSGGFIRSTDFGYDPGLHAAPSYKFVSLRAGVRYDKFDVSLFVDNLTNSTVQLSRSHDAVGAPLYYAESYRPRTIGMTGTFRY
ncbi:MAG: TonB-dependent receptor [Novosphingobium sp.]|nr:TonB-dependent receptor [Novosphingobium sp.]